MKPFKRDRQEGCVNVIKKTSQAAVALLRKSKESTLRLPCHDANWSNRAYRVQLETRMFCPHTL